MFVFAYTAPPYGCPAVAAAAVAVVVVVVAVVAVEK